MQYDIVLINLQSKHVMHNPCNVNNKLNVTRNSNGDLIQRLSGCERFSLSTWST